MSKPSYTTLSAQQFLTQNGMTPVPHAPYSPNLTLTLFLFSRMKKVLKGKTFCRCGGGEKKKPAEALKGIKIDEFKTVLSSGKNISIGVLYQMEIHFEGD